MADIAELRLDLMAECDLPRLLRERPCPIIVTNRPLREGGQFRGDERQRIRPLLEAIDLGVEYVDVEHDAAHLIPRRWRTQSIVSHHDFQRMPSDLADVHRRLSEMGADVVKVVGMARRIEDNLAVFDTLAQASSPTIALAMGEAGLLSRVLALRYDACFLTYAALGNGEPVAPGQLPVEAMQRIYRARQIGARTRIFGVLSAERVDDTLLALLNAATRDGGLDDVWLPFVVPGAGEVGRVVQAYRRLDVAGYLVLEPAQRAVHSALDEVSSVGLGGRVSVISCQGGRLVGRWVASLPEAVESLAGSEAMAQRFAALLGRQTTLDR